MRAADETFDAQAIAWALLTDGPPPAPPRDSGMVVERMRAAIDACGVRSWTDEWDVFYEAFSAYYDQRARRQHGVYVTPAPVVHAQVRLIDDVLRRYLGYRFDSAVVRVVDPAAGTGAYPMGVVGQYPHADWRGRLHLFEPHAGAAAVARRRLPEATVDVADVLRLPRSIEGQIVVCLGNPPYERQVKAVGGDVRPRKGGWVRYGHPASGQPPILADVVDPARAGQAGVHLKNIFNDYVYFWRWAVWAVCEQRHGPGVVSLLTPSSYLRGPGFGGLRALLRDAFDLVWVVDLEGDHLAARQTDNVFAIRTPLAIAIAARMSESASRSPARVRYARLNGPRADKLAALATVRDLDDLAWQAAPGGPIAAFVPRPHGAYATWPRLTELFPWQTSGCQMKRTWPIGPTPEVIRARWSSLLALTGSDRRNAFRPTRDRGIDRAPSGLVPLAALGPDAASVEPVRYGYRSFDRQWLLPDARLGDFMRPRLWRSAGPRQVFVTSLLTNVLGPGPAAVVSGHVPDLDYFRGSFGGRAVIPLWLDAAATQPNLAPGLLDRMARQYRRAVDAQSFLSYCYALLSSPAYVRRFAEELREPGARIPLTADADLFWRVAEQGRRLVWLHTFGERFGRGPVAPGRARLAQGIADGPMVHVAFDANAQALEVGNGRVEGVATDVWAFSVSGLRVVKAWIERRLARPRRHAASPLDLIVAHWSSALSRELLELLWVLEATLETQPELESLLNAVAGGETIASRPGKD